MMTDAKRLEQAERALELLGLVRCARCGMWGRRGGADMVALPRVSICRADLVTELFGSMMGRPAEAREATLKYVVAYVAAGHASELLSAGKKQIRPSLLEPLEELFPDLRERVRKASR